MPKSKIERARAASKRLRERAKERKGFAVRKASMGATSYGLGKLDAGFDLFGMNINLPSIFGAPKTATVAVIGYGLSLLSKDPDGLAANVGEGMGDAGASVALFQMGRGESVSGTDYVDGADDDEVRQLVDELDALDAMAAAADGAEMAAEVTDE